MDGVLLPRVGLVGDGLHGILTLRRVDVLKDAQDVRDTEELVHIGEALGLIRGKVRRERAVGGAFSALVLTRRTCRVGAATGSCHGLQELPSVTSFLPEFAQISAKGCTEMAL